MRKLSCVVAAVACVALLSAKADDSIHYCYNDAFNGSAPSGTAPWLDATFVDIAPGTVLLTLCTDGLAKGEKVSQVDFNLDPTLTAGIDWLQFSYQNGSAGVSAPKIEVGNDAFKVGAGGFYDIKLSFDTSNKGSFGADQFVSIEISGICDLTAFDFGVPSTPSNGSGQYFSAAHIQGVPSEIGHGTTSGWIAPCEVTVPEPNGAGLLAFAGGLLLCARLCSRAGTSRR